MVQFNFDEIVDVLIYDLVIMYVVIVYCEIITGMLNLIVEVVKIVKQYGKCVIFDVMLSFGGILMDIGVLGIDFMISLVNKCI